MEETRDKFIDCDLTIEEINTYTVKELKKVCKMIKLKKYSKLNKKQIVDLIFEHKSNI